MTYKVRSNFELLSQDDNVFFVKNTDNNMIYLINEIGWFVLNNINEKTSRQVMRLLSKELIDKNVNDERLLKDIEGYIEKLLQQGFIKYV